MKTEHLTDLAHALAPHAGLKMSTMGAYSVNDGKFFDRLEQGRSCTVRTFERVMTWFDQNWPADLEWPRHIPRPSKTKKEAA